VGSSSRAMRPTPLMQRTLPERTVAPRAAQNAHCDPGVCAGSRCRRPSLHPSISILASDFPTVPVRGTSSQLPRSRQSTCGLPVLAEPFSGPQKNSPGRGTGAEEKEMKRVLECRFMSAVGGGSEMVTFVAAQKTKPDYL